MGGCASLYRSNTVNSSTVNSNFDLIRSFLFCFKKFWRTYVLFFGPLVPLFWISGDVSSGFQSQSLFCLICCFVEANVMYIPQDSPLVVHVPTSWWPACSWSLPHMPVQRWDLAHD